MLSATIMFVSLTYSGLQILVGQIVYVNIPIVENRLATVEYRQYRIVKNFCRIKSDHSEKYGGFYIYELSHNC